MRSWVEPIEADRMVADGVPFVVQLAESRPVSWWPERYVSDVRVGMLTRAEARRYVSRNLTPQVMVGELWRSDEVGELLVFVERGPSPRTEAEVLSADPDTRVLA